MRATSSSKQAYMQLYTKRKIMSIPRYNYYYGDNSAIGRICNETLSPYVQNLTSSYADQRNEGTMVVTSVTMFLLAAVFFNLNLFSSASDVSAILNPTVRLFLASSLSLFLPVMSYLFSEAKRDGAGASSSISPAGTTGDSELSLRARTILMWMLLVELLRKKVEATLSSVDNQWYSSTIDRAARIAWLGYLVFFNVRSTGKKAFYGTLWVLAAAKLAQRVTINLLLKRSFAYGRNAKLLHSYMTHEKQQEVLILQPDGVEGSELLKECKYAVRGEDAVERRAGPKGYDLVDTTAVVTVGQIWRVGDAGKDGILQKDPKLRRLCVSFALYKLLRRRFEDLSITTAETRHCRDLIFRGICKEVELEPQGAPEIALFQLLYEEIQFLCEYYHSVLPVVLSNPVFFLANYIMFPIVVCALCILTFIICANGDMGYVIQSVKVDNYLISIGTMKLFFVCMLRKLRSPAVLFSAIDLAITMLLLLCFLYEQVWELLVFALSNWQMVSLVCEYTAKPRWKESCFLRGLIRCILWVRSKMSRPNLCFKQFSVLGQFRHMFMWQPTEAVPKEVKRSIMEHTMALFEAQNGGAPHSNDGSWSVLQLDKYVQFNNGESVAIAEVILILHIATCLLEERYPLPPPSPPQNKSTLMACIQKKKKTPMGAHRKVATTLSKYCAYLVAFHPELLPDDTDGTERVYKDMVTELKKEMGGSLQYLMSRPRTRYEKLMNIDARPKGPRGSPEENKKSTVQKGAKLGKALINQAVGDDEGENVWKPLANLWTELTVYAAPSSNEVHVKAHKEVLAHGGEFVTMLWALATHTGITRPALAPWEASCHNP